jgi:hypothetical protein
MQQDEKPTAPAGGPSAEGDDETEFFYELLAEQRY